MASRAEIVRVGVSVVVAGHLVASILQNAPDSYNYDLRKLIGGWTVPGWRFFAPTPGVQNVHLLVRHRGADGTPTRWVDVTPVVRHGWWCVLLNPWSRGPKALFDAMQQFSVMRANNVPLSWASTTPPYELVAQAARAASDVESRAVQFLLVNEFPHAFQDERFTPLLTSAWMPVVSPGEAS